MEQARIRLLQATEKGSQSDFHGSLAMTAEALALADEHADEGSLEWFGIRCAILEKRLLVLLAVGDVAEVADTATSFLHLLQTGPEQYAHRVWLRMMAATLRASALAVLRRDDALPTALQGALRASAQALHLYAASDLPSHAQDLLDMLWTTIQDAQNLPESPALGAAAISPALHVFAAAWVRWPTQRRRNPVEWLLHSLMAAGVSRSANSHGRVPSNRTRRHLRRQLRAVRRWIWGKRLPGFIVRWSMKRDLS